MNGRLLEWTALTDSAKVVAFLAAIFLCATVVAGAGAVVVRWLYLMVV